jgi:hypothetical protein
LMHSPQRVVSASGGSGAAQRGQGWRFQGSSPKQAAQRSRSPEPLAPQSTQ